MEEMVERKVAVALEKAGLTQSTPKDRPPARKAPTTKTRGTKRKSVTTADEEDSDDIFEPQPKQVQKGNRKGAPTAGSHRRRRNYMKEICGEMKWCEGGSPSTRVVSAASVTFHAAEKKDLSVEEQSLVTLLKTPPRPPFYNMLNQALLHSLLRDTVMPGRQGYDQPFRYAIFYLGLARKELPKNAVLFPHHPAKAYPPAEAEQPLLTGASWGPYQALPVVGSEALPAGSVAPRIQKVVANPNLTGFASDAWTVGEGPRVMMTVELRPFQVPYRFAVHDLNRKEIHNALKHPTAVLNTFYVPKYTEIVGESCPMETKEALPWAQATVDRKVKEKCLGALFDLDCYPTDARWTKTRKSPLCTGRFHIIRISDFYGRKGIAEAEATARRVFSLFGKISENWNTKFARDPPDFWTKAPDQVSIQDPPGAAGGEKELLVVPATPPSDVPPPPKNKYFVLRIPARKQR